MRKSKWKTEAARLADKRNTKEFVDRYNRAAEQVPESTRQEIFAMKKSQKSVREIAVDLEMDRQTVSTIVIQEFAKERGETPMIELGGYEFSLARCGK